MSNTAVVYARIDTNLKKNAESILHQLGISPSSAIQMFYSQIVLKNGIPLDLHLSYDKPVAIGSMTHDELDKELAKGYESVSKDKSYTTDEVNQIMKDKFNI